MPAKKEDGVELLASTPLPSDALTAESDYAAKPQTLVLKLRDNKGDHSHADFAAKPSTVHKSLNSHNNGPNAQHAEGYAKVATVDLEAQEKRALGERLRREGASDVFKKTMWTFNFLVIFLFIVLELKLVANPTDMMKWHYFKNATGVNETKTVITEEMWGFRHWKQWNFNTEEMRCGYERQFIWTKEGGVHNPDLCFKNWIGWVLIVTSRSSAAMMYIFFTTVILTKLRFFLSVAQTTAYSDIWPFHMMHDIHAASGKILLVDAWLHTWCHLARFFINSDPTLFYAAVTISGWWAFLVMNIICGVWNRSKLTCPVRAMIQGCVWICGKLSFETEYMLHMSWATFAVVMFWHRYRHGVYWCVVLSVFLVDRWLERCVLTKKVRDIELKAGKSGTLLRWMWYNQNRSTVAPVELAGSIVRINLPKFSTTEYHPFSAFYDPYDVRYACAYIHNAGNWTGLLHEYAKFHKHLPHAWIAGPLFSEFQACMAYRNILCVCSGTAFAPIAGLAQYWEPGEHTVTVIWVLRDKNLISQLLPTINPSTRVIIYYTGKKDGKQLPLCEDDCHDVAFFDRPEEGVKNAVSALLDQGKVLRMSSTEVSPDEGDTNPVTVSTEGRHIEVHLGRPRNWEKIIKSKLAKEEVDPLAENCVAISTGVIRMAVELEEICNKNNVPSVRCDASFG